jgi:hypothetical protein
VTFLPRPAAELEPAPELSAPERQRLAELEAVVERGLDTFAEVGRALLEIRDERLYRETHGTFEAYLRQRWGMSRRRGYQLIDAARVSTVVDTAGLPAPPSERVARELAPVLRAEGEQAVVEVVRSLRAKYGDRVTHKVVEEAVSERLRREQVLSFVTSSDSCEWYTPEPYVEAVREVLGDIDLDPASCALANETVRASEYYDIERDGLSRPWHGRVFCNPPYGRQVCALFVAKAVKEYRSGRVEALILLLNGYGFDAAWFQPLWDGLLCFTDHRIRFRSPTRPEGDGGPSFGSVFVYLGPDPDRFARVFSRFGTVVERYRPREAA